MNDRYLKRAFAIEIPENVDLNRPPVTGFDYLYRVQLETRKCPKVVVSNIDTTQFLDRRTVKVDICSGFIAARPGFAPDPEWKEMVLEEFHSCKVQMLQNRDSLKKRFPRKPVPPISKAEEWCLFCLGAESQQVIYNDNSEASDNERLPPKAKKSRFSAESHPPLLSVVMYLHQKRVIRLLSYFDDWLEDVAFNNQVGKWIYSLLVCLDKPLDPDTCSLLRNLSRRCCKFRDNISSPDSEILKPLNMIITIIANYFDQKDLSDEFIAIA